MRIKLVKPPGGVFGSKGLWAVMGHVFELLLQWSTWQLSKEIIGAFSYAFIGSLDTCAAFRMIAYKRNIT